MPGHIPQAANVHHNTPDWIVAAVKEVMVTISLDPCSNDNSIVNAENQFKLPEINGLKADWAPYNNIYINPPFGKCYIHSTQGVALSAKEYKELDDLEKVNYNASSIKDWIDKGSKTIRTHWDRNPISRNQIIYLLPAAVGTKHWQQIIFKDRALELVKVCFIEGRIRFMGAAGPAPMDCAIVQFTCNPNNQIRFEQVFKQYGTII
jgi:hypothetical protein